MDAKLNDNKDSAVTIIIILIILIIIKGFI